MNEHELQSAYFDWIFLQQKIDDRYLWAYSIPNGIWVMGASVKKTGALINKMKKEGLTPGVADVCIPWPTKRYHGLYLEFKAPKKKVNPGSDQDRFLLAMRDRGYAAGMVNDLDFAINLTKNYMR